MWEIRSNKKKTTAGLAQTRRHTGTTCKQIFPLEPMEKLLFIAVVDRLLWPQMQDANMPHAHVFAHGKSTLWRAFHEHTHLAHTLIKGILELHYIHNFKLTVSCTRGHEVSRFSWVHWTVLLPGWNLFLIYFFTADIFNDLKIRIECKTLILFWCFYNPVYTTPPANIWLNVF